MSARTSASDTRYLVLLPKSDLPARQEAARNAAAPGQAGTVLACSHALDAHGQSPAVGGVIARKSRIMQHPTTSRPTILLVDDDPIILTMLAKVLSAVAPSYDVVALPNGTQALDYLSERSIALVVTDYNMPGLDGLQLARLVKIQQPGTPVMLISGVVFRSLEAEVDSYLVKPFSLMDMQQAVDAVLTPSQQREHPSVLAN